MLPQANRIRGKKEFAQVLEAGEIIQTPLFGLAFLKEGKGFPRFGFIVSNKISKLAHERNRAKRLLRRATRNLIIKIENGFLFVLLAKHKILSALYEEVAKQLEGALRRARALKEI